MEKETQMTMSEKQKKISTFFVPDDILLDMFSRLPVKSLLRIRWTCKYWFDLIKHPDFVKMHLHHSTTCAATRDYQNTSLFLISENPPFSLYLLNYSDLNYNSSPPKTVQFDYFKLPLWFDHHTVLAEVEDDHCRRVRSGGSCNGLIFLYSYCNRCYYKVVEHEYFLWNPSMRELKKLPYRKYKEDPYRTYGDLCFNGFGYDHTIDDYKVIDIVCYGGGGDDDDDDVVYPEIIINIYTLGSNSWSTKISTHQLCLGDLKLMRNIHHELTEGCFSNGSLHWIWGSAIISMSLDTLEVDDRQIQPPNDGRPPNNGNIELRIYMSKLEVLNGCLCMVYYITSKEHGEINYDLIEFWMMKDYGVNESWTKLCTINSQKFGVCSYLNDLKPIELCKDGGIVMVVNQRCLVLYDLKDEKHRWVQWIGDHRIDPTVRNYAYVRENYIESLVSLKSGMFLTAAGSTTTVIVQNPQ